MDFRPATPHRELAARVLSFARAELGPSDERFSVEAWRKLGSFGVLGLSVPEQHGGLGLGAVGTALAIEALGRGCEDGGLVFSACAHLFACAMAIAESASDPLKERVLPRLARGEWIGANAITEAEAGSDVFSLRACAVPVDGGYRLTGTKTFVTNAPVADIFVVYAKTEPSHGHLGITAFVVERGARGLHVGEPFAKIGLASSPIAAVYFDDCLVSADDVVGRVGDGAAVFAASMAWERSCLFAGYLGAMERQLEATVLFARERRQFGKSIGKNQAVSHRIADMKLRLEAARLLLYRACWLRDQGVDATLEVSLAKLAVSEAAVRSGIDAIAIHGGTGVVVEAGIERALRDAVPATVFSGTSDMQREIIAQRLGL